MNYSEPNFDINLLTSFSLKMSSERDEAIRARKTSGLDEVWKKAREQYQGIDEVNRERSFNKSETLDGSISTVMGTVEQESRSTTFVNITRPYTNAGTARVADILLPTGGKHNWDLRPTPISEMALLASFIREHPELMAKLPEDLQMRLTQTKEQQEASIGEAKELIKDWLIEAQWHNHTREQIVESGKVGTGAIKGPFPKQKKLSAEAKAVSTAIVLASSSEEEALYLQKTLENRLLYQPAIDCIPVENCYPDMPSCGNDIQNGRFFWEEIPNISRLEMQDLRQDSDYFPNQLDLCLEEDPKPNKAKGETANKKKKSYTRWRRTGEINLSKIQSGDMDEPVGDSPLVWAELEIINDRIVKINEPVLADRKFPYHMLLWEARQDSWAGIGIPEQIETPQRGLNASVRAGNDNLGWSVGFQIILGKGLEAIKGTSSDIEQYKIWRDVTDSLEASMGKARSAKDAIGTIEFPNHLDKVLPWINFWLQMAESTTGLTLLMQGQKATDSVGVSQMLMNSSTTNLRMFVKHWDDDNCAPIVQDMYSWVQHYGPESARGDAVAQALGSSVLIVRDLQQQALVQLLDRFVQPVYGKSPEKGMDLFLESLQFDPRQLDLSDEERERLEAAANEPDPKVQVEQLRSETDRLIEQMRDARDRMKIMLDAQLKGASIDQASEAVDTQVSGSLALEGIKQEGEKEKPAEGAKPAQKPEPVPEPVGGEPSPDEALAILGLGE